nr:MAG TPA: tail protein [Caudoviricetes sp.]
MGKSKIIYGGTVLIDLTADTIADGKVLLGYKFHGPDGEIHTGSCTFDLDTSGATVKASEVLIGKTAGARGTMITGEMPNNGAVAAKISTVNGEYIVPLGYHDGSGKCVIDPDEAAKIIAANIKKGVTIDRDKTSINLNENMDSLVPASKISDMPTGWICGQTARDFVKTKTGSGGSMNIQESEEFKTSKFYCKTDFDMKEIKKEEAGYVPLPKFYTFKSRDERERILYKNFVQVGEDVKEMIQEIQKYKVK